jgi:hypothetical protein
MPLKGPGLRGADRSQGLTAYMKRSERYPWRPWPHRPNVDSCHRTKSIAVTTTGSSGVKAFGPDRFALDFIRTGIGRKRVAIGLGLRAGMHADGAIDHLLRLKSLD